VDRNYWGVTFASDNQTFYVTVAFGGQNWLARGSLTSRTVTTMRADVECPSLSPDERRIAYKKLEGRSPGDWRIAVLDLASGMEKVLGGETSIDDQVEWLDDSRLLYGVPRDDGMSSVLTSDVWVVPADGSSAPTVLIRDASSPAVVR
jgi:Tol biopolymer transport system component